MYLTIVTQSNFHSVAIPSSSSAIKQRGRKKPANRQTVDILVDLQLSDPRVMRDARILAKLQHAVRTDLLKALRNPAGKPKPTLYSKYGGGGFPLRGPKGHKLPQWKNLSPWMKVQIASLVLGEKGCRVFTARLHDGLRAELEANGRDQRIYLRDRLKRTLRDIYGSDDVPMFFFVLEDRDKAGVHTRPHAHGVIEVRPLDLARVTNETARRKFARIEKAVGPDGARLEAGAWATLHALKAAVGLKGYRPISPKGGLSQVRNVWCRRPIFPFFNDDWITYAFKNASMHSPFIGERRLALTYELLGEARNLWGIVRGK